jgi:hypothetical protein
MEIMKRLIAVLALIVRPPPSVQAIPASAPAKTPNIVVIMDDDVGMRHPV